MDDDHSGYFYPVNQAARGKVTVGSILTCRGCGTQNILVGKGKRQGHRWWQALGWGKVAPTARGNHGKGELYCPTCYPKAKALAVGTEEEVTP